MSEAENGKRRLRVKCLDVSTLDPLPQGWCWATLDDLAAAEPNAITDGPFGSNLKTSDYTEAGPRVVRLQNIGEGFFIDEPAHISNAHFKRLLKHHVNAGDVAIAALGETLPRSCVVPPWLGPAIVKADCPRFRPNSRLVIAEYVNFALNSSLTRRRTAAIIHGVGRPRLNLSEIRGIWLPTAPLNEQRRIVAKIEELFSELDAGVAALERVKANLKRYRAAVLKAAVDGSLTAEWRAKHPNVEPASKLLERILVERRRKWEADQLAKFATAGKQALKGWQAKYVEPTLPDTTNLSELPNGWCWAAIEQLYCAERPISYGVLQPGEDFAGGIPMVRVCDVADGKISIEQLKHIDPAISAQFRRTILQGGEVLLTVVGTIGRTAVAPDALAGANTARAVAVIAVVPPALSQFLELTLREPSMRARLTAAAHEVARKTLNLEDVRVACVPLAPLAEQHDILTQVAERLSQIDAAGDVLENGLIRASRLRQSILKHAFEGKLVPQDPNDEPANLLLERIRADRISRESSDGERKNVEIRRPKRANTKAFNAGK